MGADWLTGISIIVFVPIFVCLLFRPRRRGISQLRQSGIDGLKTFWRVPDLPTVTIKQVPVSLVHLPCLSARQVLYARSAYDLVYQTATFCLLLRDELSRIDAEESA